METFQDWYNIIYESHPKLTFCEWFDETDDLWNYNPHSHPYIELIYFINGYSSIEVSGTHIPFSIYDTLLTPANHVHKDALTAEKKREIICLWVDIPELILPEAIVLREKNSIFQQQFLDIYNEYKSRNMNPMVLEYQLKRLLTNILREQYENNDNNQMLEKVLTYITYHYTEHISVSDLAEMEFISKSYLSRKFKERTGQSIVNYINGLRIGAAKTALVGGEKDITTIAYEVGFESVKYFHRVFKAMTGQTPAEFRRSFKMNPSEMRIE